jgi:ATP-dependent helicase Lhr and Lhr-like helicase
MTMALMVGMVGMEGKAGALDAFSAATRDWFEGAFAAPTPAQSGAWAAIREGAHALVVAPTGSGKTLAAFLWALDRLATQPPPAEPSRRCRVLYVSPMKALAVDVERNLRAPLTGIRHSAVRLGHPEPEVTVGVRSGDTPAAERRTFARTPPDVLITTPESLFLLLTSRAREVLAGVDTVIVDEVHAVAGTKRGAHLALSLERLDAQLERPAQRIGLSATVRPVPEVARFLGGGRPVTVVQPTADKQVDLRVVVPVPDLGELGQATGDLTGAAAGEPPRSSIWPHVEERVVDLIASHRSTLVFANSRRLAERLTARLNEVWAERLELDLPDASAAAPAALMAQAGASAGAPPILARAHHGSVSKEQRALIEDDLKAGRLPAVVATSSLELGIDMGAVDLVVQVESPPSVASGLQRVGRAGHQVGAVSQGVVFPKYRGDLVQTAVVVERMRAGEIEQMRVPANPLDVLAQQIVAMTAMDEWDVDEVEALARRAAPYATLTRPVLEAVLDMLAGRYPSEDFAELRPRVVWDRVHGTLTGRPGSQWLAVTSGGTIPDRGLYGVFLAGAQDSSRAGRRVGELDEEMVYESRVGDVFTLGTTSWRIEDITHDQVLVTPAPGQPGKLPFWHGDALGRPAELGRAVGAFVREVAALGPQDARARVAAAGLDEWAADNLLAYLNEQRQATGHLPDDRTIVVERFRDEIGDWRVVVHSPFGAQVHAPWALAMAARLRERFGVDVQAMHADDGIVLRLPDLEVEDVPGGSLDIADVVLMEPDTVEDLVTTEVGGSALFASRFRECAARALLLPRRRPDRRQPLWQQRQRAAQLLQVASQYASFPIVLETVRECLQDVYDVPGLLALQRDLAARRVRIIEVETTTPSPFASSLLFGYVAAFLYEGDSPLAERRAAALALDPTLLSELLGRGEGASLRDLLDPEAVIRTETELQRLTPDRAAKDGEAVADLVRTLGPIATNQVARRTTDPSSAPHWLADLEGERRLIRVRVGGEERWSAIEDAGRLRDALGTPLPVGVPEVFLAPEPDPLGDLARRYARTHGPFTAHDLAAWLGLGVSVVLDALRRLVAAGRLVEGELRPLGVPAARVDGTEAPASSSNPATERGRGGLDYCDPQVLRTIRRRSLAALRAEVEPVPAVELAKFLPVWQGVGGRLRGAEGVVRAVEQLAGALVPASALETLVLPSRVTAYDPATLDELMTTGEVVWSGHGALPGDDGWVALHLADTAPLTLAEPAELELSPIHEALLGALGGGGAFFVRALASAVVEAVGPTSESDVSAALWDLVWSGRVTGDTLAPLRGRLRGGKTAHRGRPSRPGRGRYAGVRPDLSTLAVAARGTAARTSAPSVAGRWALLPTPEPDPTLRAHAVAEVLLDRYGVVTRGAVAAERVPGGFAAVYKVLSAAEDAGRVRRGYFVEGLGAAQFASAGAIDRLRAEPTDVRTVVLAAADPANPYGAALSWPDRPDRPGESGTGHRPGRKAGALVVLVGGELVLYVERGGRTLLSWSEEPETLQAAADALALAVHDGALGRLTVERADGAGVLGSEQPLAQALERSGFHATPRGLRLRR